MAGGTEPFFEAGPGGIRRQSLITHTAGTRVNHIQQNTMPGAEQLRETRWLMGGRQGHAASVDRVGAIIQAQGCSK